MLRTLHHEIAASARLFPRLPSYLRRPITADEAHATLRRRRERREAGQASLCLLVHPLVGLVDVGTVRETFLGATAGIGAERMMRQVWRDAGLLRVERREPFSTRSGKILHLHVTRP